MERERIARDLHDTLFQGMQGLVYSFQAVVGKLARTDPTRTQIEGLLNGADRVLGEARDRVDGLRADERIESLPAALEKVGYGLEKDFTATFVLTLQGADSALDEHVASEIYFACREALINAFQHAQAKAVTLHIDLDADRARLTILDDGQGFDLKMTEHGFPPGHWGIVGMRERIERVGGRVRIDSSNRGTSVVIDVPLGRNFPLNLITRMRNRLTR
jgi:signal transduction histidine kinase